jgi:hypothetical protein
VPAPSIPEPRRNPRPPSDGAGANATLQIDVNGDGQFGSGDMEIHLVDYTGTLTDATFLLH